MKTILSAAIGAMLVLSAVEEAGAQAKAAERKVEIAIEQQSLADALNEWAKQTGLQLVSQSSEKMNTTVAPKLKGEFTAQGALDELLKGTALTYEWVSERAVAIREKPLVVPAALETTGARERVEVPRLQLANLAAQDQQDRGTDTVQPPQQTPRWTQQGGDFDELEEVVVTGTRLRGGRPPSPISVYDRNDLQLSGAGNISQFMRTLPNNVNATSEVTGTAVNGGRVSPNRTGGSGIDLRGLGTESTLVLVNGRRIAAGNTLGNFVDVSMLPLSAIERIEVVSDGASAIYGSDAVGGVVNFILRRDLDGMETRARYGSVTSGSNHELQLGATPGHHWDSGSGLLTYEYYDQTPLDAQERSSTKNAPGPFTLIPTQRRHSLFTTIEEELSPEFRVFADGSYARRSSTSDFATALNAQRYDADVENYNLVTGMQTSVGQMAVELSASYGASSADQQGYARDDSGTALWTDVHGKSELGSIDVQLNGSLVQLRHGPIVYALGGQYREETFDFTDRLSASGTFQRERNVTAGFVEVRIPLVGDPDPQSARARLELTLADRYERYSDFGSTNNPKMGFHWQATSALALRGTYGTSFRAPLLNDLNPVPSQVFPAPLPDPALDSPCDPFGGPLEGCTNTLVLIGGNRDLEPEEATTLTMGLDFTPADLPGLAASLTYYAIDYDERITDPGAFVGVLDFLTNEDVLGPAVIQRGVPQQTIQQIVAIAGSNFSDFICLCDLSTVSTIADARLHNLSAVKTDGLDLKLSYVMNVAFGSVEAGLDSTRILNFENRFSSSSPRLNVLDTQYNPLDLRARARVVGRHNDATFGLFVNYAGSYRDTQGGGSVRVDSWTTADLSFGWEPRSAQGLLKGLSVAVGVNNVLDREPPYLANPVYPINFDGANASPVGRFIYAQIAKKL